MQDKPIISPIPPFSLKHRVGTPDLDELQHVNNVVYLDWINRAAIEHWNALTTPEQRGALAWVALRHEIDYFREACLGDTILITTWTGRAEGLRYARHTRIERCNGSSRERLASSLSLWCPIDPLTRKPRRPSAAITALFQAPGVMQPAPSTLA